MRKDEMLRGRDHRSDPTWRHYTDTVLEFFPNDGTIAVDLRQAAASASIAQLLERGLAAPFAVVTACNPHGRGVSDAENRRRSAELERQLHDLGWIWIPADGCSPDGAHRESGVAVCMPQHEAICLARSFEQSAIFWFDGIDFWLVGASVDTVPRRLPVDARNDAHSGNG